MAQTLSREQALSVLSVGHEQVLALIDGLSEGARLRAGLGGGEWSIKDLLGHLTSWEEHALGAIKAWSNGESIPPIYTALESFGLDGVNQQTWQEKSSLPYQEVLQSFEAVHSGLIDAIGSMTDETWHSVPIPERNRELGEEVGGILGGAGAFDHAEVHIPDLRAWVSELRND